jgi:hypothetical protein
MHKHKRPDIGPNPLFAKFSGKFPGICLIGLNTNRHRPDFEGILRYSASRAAVQPASGLLRHNNRQVLNYVIDIYWNN